MKKVTLFILSLFFLLILSACSGQSQQTAEQPATEETTMYVTVPETTELQFIEVTAFKGSFEMQDSYGNTYITADDIKSAKAEATGNSESMYYVISVEFNEEGKQKLADATAKLLGEELKIIVDGETICSPIINSPITDGKAQIEGDFTLEEINDILLKMQG